MSTNNANVNTNNSYYTVLPTLPKRLAKQGWQEIMFADADSTIGYCTPDGLIFVLPLTSAVAAKLATLPKDEDGWYFNSSKDRYCAEDYWDHFGWQVERKYAISVNPSFAFALLGEIIA